MKAEIQKLIEELKNKNSEMSEKINGGKLNDYNHTIYVHSYNMNLDFVKKLENLIRFV